MSSLGGVGELSNGQHICSAYYAFGLMNLRHSFSTLPPFFHRCADSEFAHTNLGRPAKNAFMTSKLCEKTMGPGSYPNMVFLDGVFIVLSRILRLVWPTPMPLGAVLDARTSKCDVRVRISFLPHFLFFVSWLSRYARAHSAQEKLERIEIEV